MRAQEENQSLVVQETVRSEILKALQEAPDVELDALALSLPTLSWNQVFLEVDRMSRSGELQVRATGGIYLVRLGRSSPHPLSTPGGVERAG